MPSQVSLILTVYNRERFLKTAIESILCQTYTHFQLILWDDGSTDNSLAIANHYANQDARIRLIAAPHQGRAPALAAAHTHATGDYLAWVDSDDSLAPTALESTVAILDRSPNIGMVYTDYWATDAQGQNRQLGKRCQISYSPHRLLIDFITFHFRLLRRSLYEQVGGIDPSFACAMDYDLCLKLSEVTEVYHLAQPLYDYRTHPHSISGQQRLVQTESAARAVCNAIERRGLGDCLELEVIPPSRFRLRQKTVPHILRGVSG
jgi:glycosyltransferase involved in cell wall biosynthesis